MNDMTESERDQLGGYAGSSPRALGTDVREAFVGSAFVGGPEGQATRAMLRTGGEHYVGSLDDELGWSFFRKLPGAVAAAAHGRGGPGVSDPHAVLARALRKRRFRGLKPYGMQSPSSAFSNIFARLRSQMKPQVSGWMDGPLGQVPRAMPRPAQEGGMSEHYVSGPYGQVPRAMPRPAQEGGMSEHYISGPFGQVPRATVPGTTDLYVGQLGYEELAGSGGWRRLCKRQLRKIKHAARNQRRGRKVPAGLINTCLMLRKNAFVAKHKRQPDPAKVARWKAHLLRIVAKHGGQIDGSVTVMGDWISSAFGFAGNVVAKAGELGVRMAKPLVWDLPIGVAKTGLKVAKGVVWDAPRDTFFKKKPAARPPVRQVMSADYYDNPNAPRRRMTPGTTVVTSSTLSMASRIARRKGYTRRQAAELAARIEESKNRKALAELEQAEFNKLQELEKQAAQAEADAAQAEADVQDTEQTMPIEGDFLGYALKEARVASLIGSSKEARIAQEVLKTAGELAKATILDTRWGKLFSGFRNIYKAATKDPKAPEKVAELKKEAAAGNKQAEKVVDILKLGKKTDDQLKAANIVEKELNKEADKKAAAVSGCSGDDIAIIGMLPSSRVVISTIPGAEMIYDLAKKGNPTMLEIVKMAADLLRRKEAGDAAAGETIVNYGKQAKEGNRRAQLFMAAAAVAAAGIREEKALDKAKSESKGVMGQATAQAQRIAADPAAKARLEAQVHRTVDKWRKIFAGAFAPLAAKQIVGTSIKVAQGQARAAARR